MFVTSSIEKNVQEFSCSKPATFGKLFQTNIRHGNSTFGNGKSHISPNLTEHSSHHFPHLLHAKQRYVFGNSANSPSKHNKNRNEIFQIYQDYAGRESSPINNQYEIPYAHNVIKPPKGR